MPQTLFEFPVEIGTAWEDRPVYTFVRRSSPASGSGSQSGAQAPGSQAKGPASGAPLSARALAAASASPAAAQAPAVPKIRANVVVIREAQKGKQLGDFAKQQKKAIIEGMAGAAVVREGPVKIGPLDAFRQEFKIAMERPLPTIIQWHVSTVRDGQFFHFCGTTTMEKAAEDRAKFDELLASWAGAPAGGASGPPSAAGGTASGAPSAAKQ